MPGRKSVRDSGFGQSPSARRSLSVGDRMSSNDDQNGQGQDAQDVLASIAAAVSMKQTTITVPPFTGLPKGQTYEGPAGLTKVDIETDEWIENLDDTGVTAQWSPEIIAKQACMAFVPNTPARTWYLMNKDETFMQSWPELKIQLIQRFSRPLDPSTKVQLISSFRQKNSERVEDFLDRVKLSFRRYTNGLHWTEAEFSTGESLTLKSHRLKSLKKMNDYNICTFFMCGLKESLLAEVTKAGVTSLEDILSVAKRAEQAQLQAQAKGKVAASNDVSQSSLEAAIAAALDKALNARNPGQASGGQGQGQAAVANQSGQSQGRKKNPDKPKSDVICFYCIEKGHYANHCDSRADDRKRGVWRPTIDDPEMNKEQYGKLSTAEKTKGRDIAARKFGLPSGNQPTASVVAAPPPAYNVWDQQFAANLQVEQQFVDYFRQGNDHRV